MARSLFEVKVGAQQAFIQIFTWGANSEGHASGDPVDLTVDGPGGDPSDWRCEARTVPAGLLAATFTADTTNASDGIMIYRLSQADAVNLGEGQHFDAVDAATGFPWCELEFTADPAYAHV